MGRVMTRLSCLVFLFVAACAAPPERAANTRPITTTLRANAIAFLPDRANPRCAVVKVVDGDTVDVQCQNSGGRVRLMGFDTPETHQAGCRAEKELGLAAKAFLQQRLAAARRIIPETRGPDKYGRLLARFIVDGKPLEQIMVAQGLAVYYDGGRRINWCAKLKAA